MNGLNNNILSFPGADQAAGHTSTSVEEDLNQIFSKLERTKTILKEEVESIPLSSIEDMDPFLAKNKLFNEAQQQMENIDRMRKKIRFYLDEIEFFRSE